MAALMAALMVDLKAVKVESWADQMDLKDLLKVESWAEKVNLKDLLKVEMMVVW